MKEILIIRSVSFQQLDMTLHGVVASYPNSKISLLTHEHGVKLAEKYRAITEIISYPYRQSFSFFRPVNTFRGRHFDCVIIPVTNITGAGFFNVLLFSLSLNTKQRVICNVVSQFREINSVEIVLGGFRHVIFSAISLIGAGLVCLFAVPYLLYKLPQLEKKQAIQ